MTTSANIGIARFALMVAVLAALMALAVAGTSNAASTPAPNASSYRCVSDKAVLTVVNGVYLCDENGHITDAIPAVATPPPSNPVVTEEVRYVIGQLENTLAVYRWQFYSSIVIFVCVIGLVVTGLWFAYMQFAIVHRVALTRAKLLDRLAATAVSQPELDINALFPAENVSVETGKVAVHTSYVGLAVLTLSLAFFFLYLKVVYPISVTGSLNLGQACGSASSMVCDVKPTPAASPDPHGTKKPSRGASPRARPGRKP